MHACLQFSLAECSKAQKTLLRLYVAHVCFLPSQSITESLPRFELCVCNLILMVFPYVARGPNWARCCFFWTLFICRKKKIIDNDSFTYFEAPFTETHQWDQQMINSRLVQTDFQGVSSSPPPLGQEVTLHSDLRRLHMLNNTSPRTRGTTPLGIYRF